MMRASAFLLAALLCGCETGEPLPPFDVTSAFHPPAPFAIPGTGYMVGTPDFANAHFATTTEVALRSGQEDEDPVVAILPKDTPVVLAGVTGSECVCVKVATPEGVGWLYTRYIALRGVAPPIDPETVSHPAMEGSAGSAPSEKRG